MYESKPHSLPLVGQCQDMCPEYERYEREVHLDLSPFEMIPGSERPVNPGDHPCIDHGRAVKKYHRPAAGNEAPLPEDVRPPAVLRRTMHYLTGLIDYVYAEGGLESFAQVQKFVRDRTRSIRQDATLQNLRVDPDNLVVHQEIARFHIMSGHRLCEMPSADFDAFQNTEQLRKVLQSLSEFYTDIRATGNIELLPDEGEFRAYYLLTHLEDPDVYRKCFSWSQEVLSSPPVQFALTAGAAFHQTDYIRFFRLLRTCPVGMNRVIFYLCCCLLHSHFSALRIKSACVITKAYSPGVTFPLAKFAEWFAFEDETELVDFCEALQYGLVREDFRITGVTRPASSSTDVTLRPRRNERLVEAIVLGVPMSKIITNTDGHVQQPINVEKTKPVVKPVLVAPPPLFVKPTLPPPLAVKPVEVPKSIFHSVVEKSKVDVEPIAIAMTSDLITSVCRSQALLIATSVATKHNQRQSTIRHLSSDILDSLIAERIQNLASESLARLKETRARQRRILEDQLMAALLWSTTSHIIEEQATEALRTAIKSKLKAEPVHDPLEHAYESGIKIVPSTNTITTKRTSFFTVPLKRTPDAKVGRVDTLRAMIEEEKKETAKLGALLHSLLSKQRPL